MLLTQGTLRVRAELKPGVAHVRVQLTTGKLVMAHGSHETVMFNFASQFEEEDRGQPPRE